MIQLLALFLSFSANAEQNHAKHNMVMYGETEVYVSHLVYKQPHNYQVILALTLDDADRAKYLAAKKSNPDAQFIFLLDHMDIKDINAAARISGPVFYNDESRAKHEVLSTLTLDRPKYNIIFFNELPLSLAAGS